MARKEVTKGSSLFKNGLAALQPDYTDAKLRADIGLLAELDARFADIEGQDYACHAVKEQLFGILRKPNKSGPAAIFVFVGPPAVGKTMLAQKIGEALGRPFERFDMSGYSDKEAPISLFGLNKSYKSAAPGRFTTYIKEHPMSVILFDEIEKAHATVRNNILQMLDKGAVRDLYYERDFSVRDCILIFTTNVGTNAYNAGNPYNLSTTPMATVIRALEEEKDPVTGDRYFSRELVSRFASGRIIVFNKLRPEVLHRIAVRNIAEMMNYYYGAYNIKVITDKSALADYIIFSQGGNADARSIVRAVREFFSNNFERSAELVSGLGCGGRICRIRFRLDFDSATAEAAEVLSEGGHSNVLSYGGDLSGYIYATERGSVTLVEAEDDIDIHGIKRLAPAIAFVGVTAQNLAKAKAVFNNLIAAQVPVYVYTRSDSIPLTYYADNGAVDCHTRNSPLSFSEWISDAAAGIDLSRSVRLLFRTNKIITCSTSYKYYRRSCSVDILLSDFAEAIAFGGGESALFEGRETIPDVTFDDVIGAEEAKRELLPVIRQLRNYREYEKNGIRIPRGIILDGAPGCGKTMLAKAVANAADMPFISMNAGEFLSRWVGEGERRIREVFAAARRYAPSIVFIDEIDCIAKDRMGDAAQSAHTDGLTNSLLSELDGFDTGSAAPVFVIAATNFETRGDDVSLDRAFLRRFDKKIHINLPAFAERLAFIGRELGRYPFSEVSDGMAATIARRSVGWSLADLNLVVQNAVRHSENDGKFLLTDEILFEAFESFNAGDRKVYDAKTVERTAYHEAGHSLVASLLGLNPVYATIVARANYGGFVQFGEEDKPELSRSECLDRICAAMAGRAAEVCFFGEDGISSGAAGDIRSATQTAVAMVCDFGMDEGLLCRIDRKKALENAEIFARVRGLIAEQYGRALRLITDNKDRAEAVAKALYERESLSGEQLSDLISAN